MAFDEPAVAACAQRLISRVMRARPPDVRACLPFDPDDPDDVWLWVSGKLRVHKWKEQDTAAYAVTRLVWEAQKTGRRLSLRDLTGYKNQAPQPPSPSLIAAGVKLVPQQNSNDWQRDFEIAEEYLECAVLAVARRLAAGSASTPRRVGTLLNCLARVVWVMKSELGAEVVNCALEQLWRHPAFIRIPADNASRTDFVTAMNQLSPNGNLRRDLAEIGWPSPGLAQWAAYVCAFRHYLRNRNGNLKEDLNDQSTY